MRNLHWQAYLAVKFVAYWAPAGFVHEGLSS